MKTTPAWILLLTATLSACGGHKGGGSGGGDDQKKDPDQVETPQPKTDGVGFTMVRRAKGLADVETVDSLAKSGGTLYLRTDKGLAITKDEGQTFTFKTPADGLYGNRVTAIAADGNTVWAASHDNAKKPPYGLAVSRDGGETFQDVTPKKGYEGAFRLWAKGDEVIVGSDLVSHDGGKTWTKLAQPDGQNGGIGRGDAGIYVILGNDLYRLDAGATAYAKLGAVPLSSGNVVVRNGGKDLYIAGQGLAYSHDGGATWTVNKEIHQSEAMNDKGEWTAGIRCFDVVGDVVYAVAEMSQVAVSVDGGKTFKNLHGDDPKQAGDDDGFGSLIEDVIVEGDKLYFAAGHTNAQYDVGGLIVGELK